MKTRLLYVYEERIPEDLRDLVRSFFPSDEFDVREATYRTDPGRQRDLFGWADAVLFAPGRHLPRAVLESAKRCRLMQLWSSGYDKFNVSDAADLGIPVANNGGSNAVSVAEHAILLMLACYKRLPDSHRRTVEGAWAGNSHGMDMYTLDGKTLGLVGLGNIGRHVARIARGFGARVQYHDVRRAEPAVERELDVSATTFDELLASSDIVSLHLHLNDQTRGLIGEREIGLMKASAMLVNVSRAQLVDTAALRRALEEERLGAAGLDVFDVEPTSPGDPLLNNARVVCTPHMAGSTRDAYDRSLENARKNIRRVMAGDKPLWVVNGVA